MDPIFRGGIVPTGKRNIVIVGGGVIGCTTAYYLTRHPKYDPELHSITIVDAAGIASGASGKAGGLLGLWAYPPEIVPLSFKLHEELAAEHRGETAWGYRVLKEAGKITAHVSEKTTSLRGKITRRPSEGSAAGAGAMSPHPKRLKRGRPRRHPASSSPAPLKLEFDAAPVLAPEAEPKFVPPQLEVAPPEPEPVPVEILEGTTNGFCTRWKPHVRYSDGAVTIGYRVSKAGALPALEGSGDAGDQAATEIEARAPEATKHIISTGSPLHSDAAAETNENCRQGGLGSGQGTVTATNGARPSDTGPMDAGSTDVILNRFGLNRAAPDDTILVRVEPTDAGPTVASPEDVHSNGAGRIVVRLADTRPANVGFGDSDSKDTPANGVRPADVDGNGVNSVSAILGLDDAPQPEQDQERNETIEVMGDEPNGDRVVWKKLPKQNVAAGAVLTASPLPQDLDWVTMPAGAGYERMGEPGKQATAQVHPYQFTTSMFNLALERGVQVRLGVKVTKINCSNVAKKKKRKVFEVRSVELLDRASNSAVTLEDVTDVVVAAGPWTASLVPRCQIDPIRVHSVVWEADVSPFAVFTSLTLPPRYVPAHRLKRKHRGTVDPEVYARPFGEIYACGETDEDVPLPETVDLVEADMNQCDDLVAYLGMISPLLAAAPVKSKQACYVPQRDAGPIFGPTVMPGLWVASGHTCWGIQNAPATGFLMAEMMLDGIVSSLPASDFEKFDPRKFDI